MRSFSETPDLWWNVRNCAIQEEKIPKRYYSVNEPQRWYVKSIEPKDSKYGEALLVGMWAPGLVRFTEADSRAECGGHSYNWVTLEAYSQVWGQPGLYRNLSTNKPTNATETNKWKEPEVVIGVRWESLLGTRKALDSIPRALPHPHPNAHTSRTGWGESVLRSPTSQRLASCLRH